MVKTRGVIGLWISMWLAALGPALAQQGTTEIRGVTADQQGAVLPGVAIVVTNQETGMFRQTVSDPDGSYFVGALTPGIYEIVAEVQGFKKYYRGDARLEVGKTTTIDIQLEIGDIQDVVTVRAATPLLDTSSSEIGGYVRSEEMNDVPSFNRNFVAYMSLLPGVAARMAIDSFGAGAITVSGQAFRNVNYTLDGANNNDDFDLGTGGSQVRVPLEAVQEFRLLTAQFNAEFGTTAGGVVNAVSKQGTNAFHGSAFGFFQDSALTARDYFARTQDLRNPPTRQQQWGGTLGGPIVRNKAHFFVSLERVLQDRGITINIPTRPELNSTQLTQDRVWNVLARFDHQSSARHTWAVRWLQEWSPQFNQFPSTSTTPAAADQEQDTDWTIVGTLTSVVGYTKVNTVRASMTGEDLTNGNPNFFNAGQRQDILLPTLAYLSFTDQQSSRAIRRLDRAYAFDDNFAWFIHSKGGDHEVKFGNQYLYIPLRIQNWGNQNGTFAFSHDLPFDVSIPRTYPERFSIRVPGPLDVRMKGHFISGFLQDQWKISGRLTISLGARYDLEIIPITERDNPKFDSPANDPIDKNNVSPRLGATYALDRSGRSIVRGGFGIFYQRTPWTVLTNIISQGVFADSFTVTFPVNGADPGPSGDPFPTDPTLVGGPIADRGRINALFPAGTRQKNSGEVFLDNPDRHLPWSRHITAGYERQIGTNLVAGIDYIHSAQRELYMRKNLNPGLRTSTSRTSQIVRVDPNFVSNVWEIGNYGSIDYHAMHVHVDRRLSRGSSARGSYTLSRGYGSIDMGVDEAIESQLLDDPRLGMNEGPTIIDVRHLLSISGTWDVPRTRGLKISGVFQARSGSPLTLTDSRTDPDRNGFFQEPLPPGTYSGEGPDAITIENAGGRRGARGPGYARLDLRGGYRFRLSQQRTLEGFLDIFNVTNRASFNNPTGDRRLADFLIVRSIVDGGPTRVVELNLRYAF
jgi:Carboxypeptidase regulatory-like domain